MPTLFLYYSFTGSGDVVAERMREMGAEIRKIEPKKALPRSFFAAIMKGGFLATIGHKAKLKNWDKSLSGFDRIIIGSPVWNGRFSTPINRVLASLDLAGKSVVFVLYAGSGTASKAEKRIHEHYPDASIVLLKEPKKYTEELEKLASLF